MIDQQIDIPTKDGKTTTFITHPERGGPFPVIIFYMDAPAIREELRDMARRLAHLGLLRDAAQHVLPLRRHGARADPAGPGSARAQADVRLHELASTFPMVMEDTKALLAYADGADGREHRHRRHRRLLHERPLRGQRGDAFPGPRQGRGLDLRHASGDRPARQPASCRRQDQGRTLFRLRRDRHLRAAGDHREGARGHEGHRTTRSRSIPAPITASPSRSGRSTTATPPSGIGSGCWRSIAATCSKSRT